MLFKGLRNLLKYFRQLSKAILIVLDSFQEGRMKLRTSCGVLGLSKGAFLGLSKELRNSFESYCEGH